MSICAHGYLRGQREQACPQCAVDIARLTRDSKPRLSFEANDITRTRDELKSERRRLTLDPKRRVNLRAATGVQMSAEIRRRAIGYDFTDAPTHGEGECPGFIPPTAFQKAMAMVRRLPDAPADSKPLPPDFLTPADTAQQGPASKASRGFFARLFEWRF